MITVSNLTRRFGSFVAVDDVSFHLERGEVVGFLGPNGAGKTTTMRMLTGFLPASEGSIAVSGFDVSRRSLEARRCIGYLPESVPLYREHRVEEMLRFQGRLHGLGRDELQRRVGAVLDRVAMTPFRRRLIGNLSKGQRQRVGLAVALLPDPEVLILDEPTSGLDPLQRLEVRALVGALAVERTVLISSHILPEVEAVCPRVIILHQGRIVADGQQAELATRHADGTRVRLEAAIDVEGSEAARLLASLPGVEGVEDRGRRGIYHAFEVRGTADASEDVGALAAQRGWAVRELSSERPSLERLFTRIALECDEPARARGAEPIPAAPPPAADPPMAPPSPIRSLSPFENPPTGPRGEGTP